MQTTFLSICQVDIPNPVCFFQFNGFPIGSPLKVSVVFMNHTELSLSFPSTLNITNCLSSTVIHRREENVEECKGLGRGYIFNSVKHKSKIWCYIWLISWLPLLILKTAYLKQWPFHHIKIFLFKILSIYSNT